jgi:hypothetical protein
MAHARTVSEYSLKGKSASSLLQPIAATPVLRATPKSRRTSQRDLQYLPPGRQIGEVHQNPPGQSTQHRFVQVEGPVRAGDHHHSVWLNIVLSSYVLWLTDFVAHINKVAVHIIPCDRKTACLRCYRKRIAIQNTYDSSTDSTMSTTIEYTTKNPTQHTTHTAHTHLSLVVRSPSHSCINVVFTDVSVP